MGTERIRVTLETPLPPANGKPQRSAATPEGLKHIGKQTDESR